MRSIFRGYDRPSPSISATVYPVGYKMRGNDGNIWEISRDSRGVQRWKKSIGGGYATPVLTGDEYEQMNPKVRRASKPKPEPKPIEEEVLVMEEEQEEDGMLTIKARKVIEGMKFLMEDDPDMSEEIREKAQEKLNSLKLFEEDDKDVKRAADLYRQFLDESFGYGGKVKRKQEEKDMYESALQRSNSNLDKELIENKLKNLKEV